MKNRLLHALSNRPGPFVTSLFGQSRDFNPRVIPEWEQSIRDTLLLDNTGTDYYLRCYLATVMAYNDIWRLIGDIPTTYQMRDFMPKGVKINGGDFAAMENLYGYFTDPAPTTFPLNLRYQIDYVGPAMCRVTMLDTGYVETLPVFINQADPTPKRVIIEPSSIVITTENPDDIPITTEDGLPLSTMIFSGLTIMEESAWKNRIMRVAWSSTMPFSGPIILHQDWIPGARLEIEVEPSKFPYKLVIDNLTRLPATIPLLMIYKWVDEFVNTPDYAEKLAMILTILGLNNLQRQPA